MRQALAHFSAFLAASGLKNTRQRQAIAKAFFGAGTHLTAEQLYRRVSKRHPKIGLVTVYRTLKLLAAAGLAKERQFGGSQALYEPEQEGMHHDHLICTACGKIVEFENDLIESLQNKVAEQRGFLVQDHKLELYGICRECRTRERRED